MDPLSQALGRVRYSNPPTQSFIPAKAFASRNENLTDGLFKFFRLAGIAIHDGNVNQPHSLDKCSGGGGERVTSSLAVPSSVVCNNSSLGVAMADHVLVARQADVTSTCSSLQPSRTTHCSLLSQLQPEPLARPLLWNSWNSFSSTFSPLASSSIFLKARSRETPSDPRYRPYPRRP